MAHSVAATVVPGSQLYWYHPSYFGQPPGVAMGRCTYVAAEGEGIRCHRPAELLHEIPGRDPLRMYAVCLRHAEVLDPFFKLFAELVRSHELRYQAAHLIKVAEHLLGESQHLRFHRPGDQGWRTD